MERRATLVVIACLLAGCGGGAGRGDASVDAASGADAGVPDAGPIVVPPVTCEGAPPSSLAECDFVGVGFAECGGSGDPRLACPTAEDAGGCRWFLGGCVPSDHRPSPCLIDDMCCVDDFPFVASPDACERAVLGDALRARAGVVWDRTREANVSVTVDPSLAPTTSAPTVTCSGACAQGFASICQADVDGTALDVSWAPALSGLPYAVVRWGDPTFSGKYLAIEVLPGAGGELRARVLHTRYTDMCSADCPYAADPRELGDTEVARGGSIVVDDLDAPTHGVIALTMSDCFTVDVAF